MPSSHSLSRTLLPKENTEPLQLVGFGPSQTTEEQKAKPSLWDPPNSALSLLLLPFSRLEKFSIWEKFYSSQSPLLPNISPLPEVISDSLT